MLFIYCALIKKIFISSTKRLMLNNLKHLESRFKADRFWRKTSDLMSLVMVKTIVWKRGWEINVLLKGISLKIH